MQLPLQGKKDLFSMIKWYIKNRIPRGKPHKIAIEACDHVVKNEYIKKSS